MKQYGEYIKRNLLRYLDDCFIIWPTKWDPLEFVEMMNHLHSNIKFTMERNEKEIPFLDILVYMKDNKVLTDLYSKPTDSHQYLHFKSCHPRHTKQSIPYSQARRLCTIIDDNQIRDKRLEEMKTFFLQRGYPLPLINDGIAKAKSIPQDTLRSARPKQKLDTLPFVSTNNPRNPNLGQTVKSTLETLCNNNRMLKVLNNTKYIKCTRQPKNLKKMLTKAKFTSIDREYNTGSQKCQDKRCGTCPFLQECKIIKITSTGRTFKIQKPMTCKSRNVLYILTCQGCKEQYVGMTNDTLAARMRVHKQQIKTPKYRKLGVSKHLAECPTDSPIKFTVTPFFKLNDTKTEGLIKENLFIEQFNPKLNNLSL